MLFIGIAAGIALLFVAAVYTVYRMAFYSAPSQRNKPFELPAGEQYECFAAQTQQLVKTLEARPFETVSIRSHDGLCLVGQYYHVRDGAPLDIGIHGYRGTIARDFCGGSALSIGAGHNALYVQQRAQGKSEGDAMTFGIMERLDCLDWIRYAVDRFGADVKITLYGVSMGATTVLMASGLDLPPQVRGIVADCPFDSPLGIIRKVAKDRNLPAVLADVLAPLAAKWFGGFDLCAVTAAEAVKIAKIPVLLIHGEEDRFVPCEMSRAIAAAGGDLVRLHTFPQAGHGLSYMLDFPRYRKLVLAFWEEVLA